MKIFLVAAITTLWLAQAPAPSFEVASIKPSNADPSGDVNIIPAPGRLTVTNAPLRMLLVFAYRLQDSQLVGGPGWVTSLRFDISARAPGNPAVPEMLLMLRTLLTDRFHLGTHYEQREQPVYALVRDGNRVGPQLKSSTLDCSTTNPVATPACEYRISFGRVHGRGMRLTSLATALSAYAGRVVVDRTGINDAQDFDVNWSQDSTDTERPSLFAALQEQLGLKLESTRAPVDVLVIDRVEKPTSD